MLEPGTKVEVRYLPGSQPISGTIMRWSDDFKKYEVRTSMHWGGITWVNESQVTAVE